MVHHGLTGQIGGGQFVRTVICTAGEVTMLLLVASVAVAVKA
jgi:hypothetical protein